MAASVVLSEIQRDILTRVCDTFAPSLDPPEGDRDPHGFWARSASDLGIPGLVEQTMAQRLGEEQLEGLRQLLDALAGQGFADAPLEGREQILHAVADSSPEALGGIAAFQTMGLMLFYGVPDPQTGMNPNWPAIGYPGPRSAPPDEPKPIRVQRPEGADLELEADVVVVGSGAGGGVIAGTLAQAGSDVVVLEMGGYFNEADFNQLELWAYENLYRGQGLTATANGSVGLLAGSNLGGGTTINWTNSLPTTPWVREQWETEFGLEGVNGPDYDRHLDGVMRRIGVTDRCSDPNVPHELLHAACEKLGYAWKTVTRNADPARYDPASAGYLHFGDQSGSKQGTLKTYLVDAHEAAARIVVNCRVDRVLVEGGRAAGVEGTYTDGEGRRASVRVRARQVVVAGGSLESPALLLRSRIGGPAVGKYLRLHPATAMVGVYERETNHWWGAPQTGLSNEFADLQDGYGFLIESSSANPAFTGSGVPWESGRQHKELMVQWDVSAPFVFLIRDRGHGEVSVDGAGNAVHHYHLGDPLDERHFRRGLREMCNLHRAAGARAMFTFHRKQMLWRDGADFEDYAQRVHDGPLSPYEHGIFALHQMGSCRMGTDPQTSVAGPWGELHDVPGVWIGDASAFPTASGTNPMITTMALAARTAEAMRAAA